MRPKPKKSIPTRPTAKPKDDDPDSDPSEPATPKTKPKDDAGSSKEILERVKKSTALIEAKGGWGTGFVIKPGISYNGLGDVGHVGDTVVVTETGCERLGTRPIEQYWHFD